MRQASPGGPADHRADRLEFLIRTVLLAERSVAPPIGHPSKCYSPAWQSPAHLGLLKAHHAIDLPFVFDSTEITGHDRRHHGRARTGGARIADTWIASARHSLKIPEWPDHAQPNVRLGFDNECRITRDPDRNARRLWTRLVKG